MQLRDKPHMSFVILGHIDAGKTTIFDQLTKFFRNGRKSGQQLRREAQLQLLRSNTFKYVWFVNKFPQTRDRLITINLSFHYGQTKSKHLTIIDAPGHIDFNKNMMTGVSQADYAILVVAAPQEQYQSGISKEGRTREHALACFVMGIKKLIICINKIDSKSVNYEQARFKQIQLQMTKILLKIGYKNEALYFVPVSGFLGDNMIKKSNNIKWYQGPTLLQVMDSMQPPIRQIQKPLRIIIKGAFKIGGVGTVAVGKIQSGILKPGMKVKFAPSNIFGEVKSIQMHNVQLKNGMAGDNIGFNIRGLALRDIKKGYICGDYQNNPPEQVESFIARIQILNHPRQIRKGYTPIVYCHSQQVACEITDIMDKLDKQTGKPIDNIKPQFLKNGDCGLVVMRPIKPFCCELFSQYSRLGRIRIMDQRKTVGAGIIKSINKKQIIKK